MHVRDQILIQNLFDLSLTIIMFMLLEFLMTNYLYFIQHDDDFFKLYVYKILYQIVKFNFVLKKSLELNIFTNNNLLKCNSWIKSSLLSYKGENL